MERTAIESNDDEPLKSQIAIRCAKAALLLLSLKSSPNRRLNSPINHEDKSEERTVMLMRDVNDLKTELVKERVKNKKIRLCSVMELLLQITILIPLWTICLMFAFKFL